MTFELQPTLQSDLLEVRPLRKSDFPGLFDVASDPLIWEQHPASDRYKEDVFRVFFQDAIDSGGALVVVDRKSNKVIGSSRYHAYSEENRTVEIGWTFLAKTYWGGDYNGDLKQLMLDHAFRQVDSVLFLIGPDNVRSKKAVEKIGGTEIGSRTEGPGGLSLVFEVTETAHETR
jgi:RimJ/RimL family protein N-acetyltransferase